MKCYIFFFIILLLTNNAIFGSNLLTFFYTQETDLTTHIQGLPLEIRKYIYFKVLDNLKKYNQEIIKTYVHTLKINPHMCTWYDIHCYFSFKNYGSECTNIIAFYPKKGGPHDHGMESSVWGGNEVIGSSAIAFMHTVANNGTIETIDCLKGKIQIQAPLIYNGIQLHIKNPGHLSWFNLIGSNSSKLASTLKFCFFLQKIPRQLAAGSFQSRH